MRGEAAPLQAQLGLGPWTRNDDCLQVIPAPRDMHGAQPGRCTGACGQALKTSWEAELGSVPRLEGDVPPFEVRAQRGPRPQTPGNPLHALIWGA